MTVRSATRSQLVLGEPLWGIRCDLEGDLPADWRTLLFDIRIDAALPAQLAELARLQRTLATGVIWRLRPMPEEARLILALRAIDALAEGASLRAIGAGIISATEWPGEGEWAKSRARRLISAARALWAGGPRAIWTSSAEQGGKSIVPQSEVDHSAGLDDAPVTGSRCAASRAHLQ